MQNATLKPAKLFIWDLDNVIYPYDTAFYVACDAAAARAAIEFGVNLSYDNALAAAKRSYETTGSSQTVFIRDYGIPQADMHRRYHELHGTDFLKPDPRMIEAFKRTHAIHAILTHSSTEWAMRVLKARGLDKFFKPEMIIGAEQVRFARKDHSRVPFEHILALTGTRAEDAMMIEDTPANLRHPRDMGMQTAFITYDSTEPSPHAEHHFTNAVAFLEAYMREAKPALARRPRTRG